MNKDKKNIVLAAKDVFRTYNLGKSKIDVLKGVDLDVIDGEWISLLGASGSGKTTLLNLIGLLEKPDSGEVFYREKNITRISKTEMTNFRRSKIGFVFQSYHLLPELTVGENIKLSARIAGIKKEVYEPRFNELISYVGLEDRQNHKPNELSGGEQQRAAIARALINDPEILLADEPTGNLDSKTGYEIIDLFRKLHETKSKTIIMVTHNEEISKVADRVIFIKDGKIEDL